MPNIFDRLRIDAYRMPQVGNIHAHSPDIASVAVRVAAASYAFTSDLIPSSEETVQNSKDIPFKSLRRLLAMGEGKSVREWYGPEGGGDSFSISVVGGAAYGVLLNDIIFVGFRGTSNMADWAINLFGTGRTGPLKIPLETEYYARKSHRLMDSSSDNKDARVHAGFYRVAQALRQPLYNEIHKLEQVYRERHGNSNNSVILTGHSLGGALALLSGLRISHQAVYTFGMPRVCDGSLIAELPACHYRYVLEGDPVPNLPPESFGFRHDMPCLTLDPYRGLQKPGMLAKALRGIRSGKSISGSMGAAAQAMFASEHDMELYVATVMAQ